VLSVRYESHLHIQVKSEAISITGRGELQGCDILRTPHCLDNRFTDGGEVVSLMHQPHSTLQKLFLIFCPWYSFLLEAE
jgi:hypothetical protein